MPYTVGTMVENSNGGSTQTTIDSPNFTAVAGDHLIAVVHYYQNPGVSATLSDTVGGNDSWTEHGSGSIPGSYGISFRIFTLAGAAAGSCTVRATFSGDTVDFPGIVVIPVTGLHASAFDQVVWNRQGSPTTGTDATTSGNTSTLANQPAMVFGYSQIDDNSAGRPAAGTGFTNIGTGITYGGSATARVRCEEKRVTATTAVAATFTAALNTLHVTCVLVLREAVAAVGSNRLPLLGVG